MIAGDLGQPGGAAERVGRRRAARPRRHPDQQRRLRLLPAVRRGRLARATPSSSSSTSRRSSSCRAASSIVARGKPSARTCVNIASIGAYQSVPNMALYAARRRSCATSPRPARRAARHAAVGDLHLPRRHEDRVPRGRRRRQLRLDRERVDDDRRARSPRSACARCSPASAP